MPFTTRSLSQARLAAVILTLALPAASACSSDIQQVDPGSGGGAGGPSTSASSGGGVLGPYWAQRRGGEFPQSGVSVAVSPSGTIGVLGAFRGTIDFGLGPLEETVMGLYDTFVVVLDASGKPLWNRNLKTSAFQGAIPPSLAFAGEDLIVAGSFSAEHTVDLGPGSPTSAGASDAFVVRFDPHGDPRWSRRFGDGDDQFALDVATDPQGNAFVSGRFSGTVDFGVTSVSGEPGNDNTFLVKLDAAGKAVAARGFDVQGVSYSHLAAGAHGDVFMVGALLGSADFGAGKLTSKNAYHLFAAAYDSALQPIYTRMLGISTSTAEQTPFSFAADPGGSVAVAAWTNGTVDFGSGPLYPADGFGALLLKLDPGGNHVWAEELGPQMWAPSIAADSASEILLASQFDGTLDFGLGPISGTGTGPALVLARFDASGTVQGNRAVSGPDVSIDPRHIAATPAGDLVLLADIDGVGAVDLGTVPVAQTETSFGSDVLVAKLPAE